MCAMTPHRDIGALRGGLGAALAAAIVLGGCGGGITVTPAGSAGLEVPVDPPADAVDRPAVPANPKPASARSTPPKTVPPADPERKAVDAASGKQRPRDPKSSPSDPKPRAEKSVSPAVEPATRQGESAALALPSLGAYAYALTGKSTLGPPPPTLSLTVAAAAGTGEQMWTLDARREDGAGIIEELTLARQTDGVYLSAYRFDVSTGVAGAILEFAPPSPVLLEPDMAAPGRTWRFEMQSTDGCAASRTDGAVISAGKPGAGKAAVRHVRLTTTLRSTGPATCPPLAATRVQDIYHPLGALLPTRLDSELAGSLAGVPAKATTQATLTSDARPAPGRRETHR